MNAPETEILLIILDATVAVTSYFTSSHITH